MNDKLHQINVTYYGKEDRLLLRVTTKKGDEYRIWLTRRFTGLVFNVLNAEMDKFGGISTIRTSQQTRQMFKSGVFDKSFEKETTTGFPLGEKGFLAFGIKSSSTPQGELLLEILPEKGAGVTITLNKSLLYMMHNLLSQGLIKAGWHQQVINLRDEASTNVH